MADANSKDKAENVAGKFIKKVVVKGAKIIVSGIVALGVIMETIKNEGGK